MRLSIRRCLTLPLVVFATPGVAAALVPSAAAGQSFTLTAQANASRPHVAVSDNGTGHFVWEELGEAAGIHYCQVPRGASACTVQRTFTPGDEGRGLHVLAPAANVVVIVSHRCCSLQPAPDGQNRTGRTVVYHSTDGGNTFAGPRVIGTLNTGGEEAHVAAANGDAAFGPGADRISLVSTRGTGGIAYQAAPFAGFTADAAVLADLPSSYAVQVPVFAAVGLVDPATPLVAYTLTDHRNVFFRVWGGSGANYHDAAGWRPQQLIGAGDEPYLASGPRGLFVLHRSAMLSERGRYVARRFDPASGRFGDEVAVSELGNLAWRDFHADRSGRLHAAWIDRDDDDAPLRYRSSVDGRTWTAMQTLVRETRGSGVVRLDIGAAPDGRGWVAYDSGAAPRSGPLLAVPIGGQTSPAVSGVSMTRRRFAVSRRAATAFRFTLAQDAAVAITIERALAGRRAGRSTGACRRPSRRLRRNRRCTRYQRQGTIRRQGKAGPNSVPFSGRIGGRALRRGSYRGSIRATGADGQPSPPARVRFQVIGR